MNEEYAAKCLAELGSPTLVAASWRLVRAGHAGRVVGDSPRGLRIPASTLSHHIAKLTWAGLVEQRRRGRNLHCFARTEVMDGLVTYLTAECCAGFDDEKTDQPAA